MRNLRNFQDECKQAARGVKSKSQLSMPDINIIMSPSEMGKLIEIDSWFWILTTQQQTFVVSSRKSDTKDAECCYARHNTNNLCPTEWKEKRREGEVEMSCEEGNACARISLRNEDKKSQNLVINVMSRVWEWKGNGEMETKRKD